MLGFLGSPQRREEMVLSDREKREKLLALRREISKKKHLTDLDLSEMVQIDRKLRNL